MLAGLGVCGLSLLSLLRRKRRHGVVRKRSSSYRWAIETQAKRRAILGIQYALAAERRASISQGKNPRRWWVRPFLRHHDTMGAWYTTIPVMKREDPEVFYDNFRMTPEAFDRLLAMVEPHLMKRSQRKTIPPGERLAITLKFLASGKNFTQLEKEFLVGDQTIFNIVFETTTVIWSVLEPLVFKPLTEETWLRLAAEFEVMWDLPHCTGGVDGKHVRIQKPNLSGSKFFNYKDFFSTMVSDAKNKILVVDVGPCGRRGDGNVFHRSQFGNKLKRDELNFPPACPVEGMNTPSTPFFFVGDAAFETGLNLVTTIKGNFRPPEEKVFNYRISRARIRVENTFGILRKRYEVLDKPIQATVPCVKSICKALCALHNFHMQDPASVPPQRKRELHAVYEDVVTEDGIVYGRYSNENSAKVREVQMRLLAEVAEERRKPRYGKKMKTEDLRESLIDYFMSRPLPWQWRAAGLM